MKAQFLHFIFPCLLASHISLAQKSTTDSPFKGAWAWQSTAPDGSVSEGYRLYWTSKHLGIQRVVHMEVDPQTRHPLTQWSAFGLPGASGITRALWFDSSGKMGQSTEVLRDHKSLVTFTGMSGDGLVSGIFHASLDEDKSKFTEHIEMWVGTDGQFIRKTPELKATLIPFNPLQNKEHVHFQTSLPILDDRFSGLMGTWRSFKANGKVEREIRFRSSLLNTAMIERWTWFNDMEEVTTGGLNVTRKDLQGDGFSMWSIGRDGFSMTGGWDFIDDQTLGQRQGDGRIIRRMIDADTIKIHRQRKINGSYVDRKGGYTLKRVTKDD
jgi:hypothetical protein